MLEINKKKRKSMFQMPESHCHDFYEVYYLVSGERKFFIKDSVYYLRPGDIVLIGKGDLHKTTFLGEGEHERIVILFNDKFLDQTKEREKIRELFNSSRIRLSQSESSGIKESLYKILAEQKMGACFSAELSRVYAYEIIMKVLRYREQCGQQDAIDEVLLDDTEKSIQQAARFLYHNYEKEIGLREIAAVAGMSEHYFSKRFKRVTGFGFKEYLTTIRMNHAVELLRDSELSITEIGIRCGFSDGNYFGDAFRKQMGMAPFKFRKEDLSKI